VGGGCVPPPPFPFAQPPFADIPASPTVRQESFPLAKSQVAISPQLPIRAAAGGANGKIKQRRRSTEEQEKDRTDFHAPQIAPSA